MASQKLYGLDAVQYHHAIKGETSTKFCVNVRYNFMFPEFKKGNSWQEKGKRHRVST